MQRGVILFVEDEVMARAIVAEELREHGYVVIEAATTDEAMQVLESDLDLDLVIVDVRMTGALDNLSLIDRIQSDFPDLKLLLAMEDSARASSTIKADAYFTKPYPFPQLLVQIKSLLATKPGS